MATIYSQIKEQLASVLDVSEDRLDWEVKGVLYAVRNHGLDTDDITKCVTTRISDEDIQILFNLMSGATGVALLTQTSLKFWIE